MIALRHVLLSFLKNEDGPTAVEYAVMLALIIVACVTAVTSLGSAASGVFSNTQLTAAASVNAAS